MKVDFRRLVFVLISIGSVTFAEKCLTPDQAEGIYVPLTTCYTQLKKQNFLKNVSTTNSFGIIPGVCCATKSNIKSSQRCGILNNDVKSPWLVAIRGLDTETLKMQTLCSGTLINERYVLTSGQCLPQGRNRFVITEVRFDRPSSNGKIDSKVVGVEQQIIHNFYNIPRGFNDIGLLRLNETISSLAFTTPVCLPTFDVISSLAITTDSCYLTTWKNVILGQQKPQPTTIISNENCKNQVKNVSITSINFCAKNSGGAVDFDIGAPIMASKNNRWYLQGILSHSSGNNNVPNIYTHIPPYLDWLEDNMRPFPESCFRKDLRQGECIPINECPELLRNYTNPQSSSLYFLEANLCSKFGEERKVCCDLNIQTEIPVISQKSNIINIQNCGKQINVKEKFPWLGEIRGINRIKETEVKLCGGVLINSDYVLTTAHCTELKKDQWEFLLIRFGDFRPLKSTSCIDLPAKNRWNCKKFEDFAVKNIIKHPFYNARSGFNDIALLRLLVRVIFVDYIQPICLPVTDIIFPSPGTMLYLFGWKENEPDGQFTLTTKLSSYEVCRKIITKTKENNILTMYDVCTLSDHISNNLVESDIPSAALVSPNKGQWFLDGVSHLPKIKNNSPLVHSKVSNYLEWIDANTEKRESCITPNNNEGLCVDLDACPPLYEALSNPNTSTTLNTTCNNKNNEVCCPLFPTITGPNGTSPSVPYLNKLEELEDIDIYCGVQQADSYARPSDAISIDEFPWLARLIAVDVKTQESDIVCGGSLINKRYVLTAAQCLSKTRLGDSILTSARLGEYHVGNSTDCVEFKKYHTSDCINFADYPIEEQIPHPYYTGEMNDIALLRLNKDVEFTDYIRPICLPQPEKPETEAQPGDTLYITGFGEISSFGDKAILKKKIPSTLISITECKQRYLFKYYKTILTVYHICTIDFENNTEFTCAGDGGGPIMHNHNNKWRLEAISSRGAGCGIGLPEVHTRVSAYLNWINGNIRGWLDLN